MNPETQDKLLHDESFLTYHPFPTLSPPPTPPHPIFLPCSIDAGVALRDADMEWYVFHQHPSSSFQDESSLGTKSLSYCPLYTQHAVERWHTVGMVLCEWFWNNSLIFINCDSTIFSPALPSELQWNSDSYKGLTQCHEMFNKGGSLRHCIDAPKSSWWRDPMRLLSDALTKGKLALCVLTPN